MHWQRQTESRFRDCAAIDGWKMKKSCKVLSEEGIEIRKTPVGCLEQVCRTKKRFVYPCPSWNFKLEQYYVGRFQEIFVVSGWM